MSILLLLPPGRGAFRGRYIHVCMRVIAYDSQRRKLLHYIENTAHSFGEIKHSLSISHKAVQSPCSLV